MAAKEGSHQNQLEPEAAAPLAERPVAPTFRIVEVCEAIAVVVQPVVALRVLENRERIRTARIVRVRSSRLRRCRSRRRTRTEVRRRTRAPAGSERAPMSGWSPRPVQRRNRVPRRGSPTVRPPSRRRDR